jgi:hypothetical protein
MNEKIKRLLFFKIRKYYIATTPRKKSGKKLHRSASCKSGVVHKKSHGKLDFLMFFREKKINWQK